MIAAALAVTIRLTVPKAVAAEASARVAGNASASAPILRLEGLQVRVGERVTIEVLGPRDPKSKMQPLLAVAGLIGSNKKDPNAPMEKMDLVVPLNDEGTRLVARSRTITLTLRWRNSRARLKWNRAFLAI
jgi:hypothetical protein